jgi:hypothetical protein
MRWRKWVVVALALLMAGPALAEWRFEYRTGPDPRYDRLFRHADPYNSRVARRYDPWGVPPAYGPRPRVVQRCWSELVPGPFGYTEVMRCRPSRAVPPGLYFRLD